MENAETDTSTRNRFGVFMHGDIKPKIRRLAKDSHRSVPQYVRMLIEIAYEDEYGEIEQKETE